jgi:anti-sigma factor RsiW
VSCDRAPSFLGAYVLGVLDPAERRDADEHLAACPACAAELAEFRGLTAQLDRLPAEEVSAEPVRPSPELFGRVQAAVRRPARRRWAAVAASAAVLGAAGITWVAVSGDEEQLRIATAGSIRVAVLPQERNEGTALDITVDGLDRGDYCMLVVTDEGGGEHPAGEWTVPGGRVSYDIWTEVPRDSLDEVVLLGSGGVEVLRVPVGN